ncbi:MAG: response regulator transcription factor [Bacillota bacterium]|nr:response regulator transcription factor [Bacillota bacterium]
MAAKTILIADDEPRIRKLVKDFLKRDGYEVVEAVDGKEALDIFFDNDKFDLIILDVMMPGYDGWAVCREIRKNSKVPIIMLTARGEESDELFGFELGADEYISKPFSPLILTARVQALLRRMENISDDIKDFHGLSIDNVKHVVSINGERIDLSPKEYELLDYLVTNEGIALSREQILNAVWEFDYFGDSRTVDTHIKRLRSKLGEKGDLIQTVRGLGYRFEVIK